MTILIEFKQNDKPNLKENLEVSIPNRILINNSRFSLQNKITCKLN